MIEANEALIWTSKPKKFQIANLRQFGSVIRRKEKNFSILQKTSKI